MITLNTKLSQADLNAFESNILIIGSGRLTHHLFHWWTQELKNSRQNSFHNTTTPQLDTPSDSTLEKNETKPNFIFNWSRKDSLQNLYDNLPRFKKIILAISDQALLPFYEDILENKLSSSHQVIHMSGAFHHEKILSVHPLMTFSHELYDLETYRKIHFAVTGPVTIQEVFSFLPNLSFELPAEHKPLYHALCVCMGNLPQILWSLGKDELQKIQVPLSAVQPYIEQSLQNFLKQGSKALTGPLVRNDIQTQQANLMALQKKSLTLFEIYLNFASAYTRRINNEKHS